MTEPRHPPERSRSLAGDITTDLGKQIAVASVQNWTESPYTEQHIRTRGKWLAIGGLAVTLLSTGMAGVWAAGLGGDMPLALLLPLQALGFGGIALGCLEYFNRPMRRAQRLVLDRLDIMDMAIVDLAGLMDEDRQQQFYRGAAWHARCQQAGTGTEDARPIRAGDVLKFRRRP